MANFDPTRLIVQLQNTGLAVKDNPLFQLLFQMLRAMATINSEVNGFISGGSSGGGSSTVINQIIQQLNLDSGSGDSSSDGLVIPGPAGANGVAGANGMVPYFIALTETFIVPLYKQALFAMNIDNEGILEVNGFLIEVNGSGGSSIVNNQTVILWEEDYLDD